MFLSPPLHHATDIQYGYDKVSEAANCSDHRVKGSEPGVVKPHQYHSEKKEDKADTNQGCHDDAGSFAVHILVGS